STVTIEVTDQDGNTIGEIVEVTVEDDGTFTQPWTIPEDVDPGELIVDGTDNDNPDINAQETLLAVETTVYEPSVTVNPDEVAAGDETVISGVDFVAGSSVTIVITDEAGNSVDTIEDVPVDENGNFSDVTWTVPDEVEAGELTVTATDEEENSAETPLSVVE